MSNTSTFIMSLLALVYLCFTLATALAYWNSTQSCLSQLLPLPPSITQTIKVTISSGWYIKLEPTDTLRLVAATAGLLWPAYLLFSAVYRLAKKIGV